jgi:N utilization substance protein B
LLSEILSDLPEFNAEEIVETQVIEHDEAATERSLSRRVALQALYELDSTGHPIGEVIAARLEEVQMESKNKNYARHLVIGVTKHRLQLDALIQHYASEFPLDQVAIIDRNILRMAIYEYAAKVNLSEHIIISEAIELATLFGAEGTARFVNGVLAALSNDYQDSVQQILSPQQED